MVSKGVLSVKISQKKSRNCTHSKKKLQDSFLAHSGDM
jgi:hypothetical protein